MSDADRAVAAWKVSAEMEKGASKNALRELLRRERLRSAHLHRTLLDLQVTNDYNVRTMMMLRMKLQALEGQLQSKRTYANIGRMLQHRKEGKKLKELDPKWQRKRKQTWVKAKKQK